MYTQFSVAFSTDLGGSNVEGKKVPYLVSITVNSKPFCGGSIIADRWILTAAHCFSGNMVKNAAVRVETNNFTASGTLYRIDRAIAHETFFPGAFRDDAGLLRLRSPLKFGERVKKIELLLQIVPNNATLTLVGRGSISQDRKKPKITQIIKAKNIALKLCRKMQPDAIYPGHLCTFAKKGKGVCDGDSGGPVVWYGRQVGIVSWSKGCAAGYSDVHARISYFLPWIKATIAANSD
ncbi:chymotrypsin-1-like [Anopheles merus]|uniref:chymotrypsin-1-like n=1 Tax=Anopheles merus TaxID=30066 RepID=UPI001BE4C616|nr:chymotrypsin-1-like [Anopheles merus]